MVQERSAVDGDVDKARARNQKLKWNLEKFNAPSVLEYIQEKADLHATEKQRVVLERRASLAEVSIFACQHLCVPRWSALCPDCQPFVCPDYTDCQRFVYPDCQHFLGPDCQRYYCVQIISTFTCLWNSQGRCQVMWALMVFVESKAICSDFDVKPHIEYG